MGRDLIKKHQRQQAACRAAMAAAQRDGALVRLGLPAGVPAEPPSGMAKVAVEATVPGCAGALALTGWDVHFGAERARIVEPNPIVGQQQARQWLAEQRRVWMREAAAPQVRLQACARMDDLASHVAALACEPTIAPCAGYLREAQLYLCMAQAQIGEDGTLLDEGPDIAAILQRDHRLQQDMEDEDDDGTE